ncbi:UpsA domain-containing protein [Halosimplex carlsbadense 2-9-1]|uniref:UpsA domain-containing protein n=1 Tax=Halosimplex carlsbadense 2-9-1 TaxID=797114 RepID=M0CU79_9EURY|nr:universal stress protein [Halosimplex carlsbadense]ELZ26805.1 UpsA domain-containing protein [Halosimplex carlsbadense 2-9-1]
MDRPLVVYDDENTELLEEAGEIASGVDAKLIVLSLMTADEFREAREALDVVAQEEHTAYDDSVVIDAAKKQARETAKDMFDDDVDYRVIGARIGDGESEADRILEVADDNGVDHVFITGQKRSPTGKAVFGDRVQSIILNFDGPVTSLLA